MPARAPDFWWIPERSLAARLLSPMGSLYGAVAAHRINRPGARASVPVICIGNFVAGGAGKTPTAIAVARKLIGVGESPAFLSRGYGRTAKSPGVLRVDQDRHDAAQAGDEPLLLARVAPTFVARDRLAAARAAVEAGASMLVLDDGLQSPALAKDLSIAVLDATTGVGNRLCHPAGPLRAPLAVQWPAVSLLCVIGEGPQGSALAQEASLRGVPVVHATLRPDRAVVDALRGRPLYGFSGIGRPEKFFRTIEDEALSLVGRRGFPDHHAFTAAERGALLADAERLGADLVTTEKDRVRLPADFPALALPVSLAFADEGPFDALLARLTARRTFA